MKHLKLIIILVISTTTLYSCKSKEVKTVEPVKVEEKKVDKKEMTFEEVSAMFGSEIAAKLVTTDNSVAKGKPTKAVIIVWFSDLTLSSISGGYNLTLPANPKWAGVQQLSTMRSLCNWYLVGSVETSKNCMTDSTGSIRGWVTDMDNNVHVSNIVN